MDAVRLTLLSGLSSLPSEYERAVCAHAQHYVALAEREGPRLNGAGMPDGGRAQLGALRAWGVDLENILAALDNALQRDRVDLLLPPVQWIRRYLDLQGTASQMQVLFTRLLDAALRLDSGPLTVWAKLGLGRAQGRLSKLDAARELFSEALEQSREMRDRELEAVSLHLLGLAENVHGSYGTARETYRQLVAIRRELGQRWGEAIALHNLALVEWNLGNPGVSQELDQQAVAIFREVGDRQGEAICLMTAGQLHMARREYQLALDQMLKAVDIFHELGDRVGYASALSNLGVVHFYLGAYNEAADLQLQALGLRRTLGEPALEASSLCYLTIAHYKLEEYSAALLMVQQALGLLREHGDLPGLAQACAIAGSVLAAQGSLRPAALALQGALASVDVVGYKFEDDDLQIIGSGQAHLATAVASSTITSTELAQWKAEGEAVSLDELAGLTLKALAAIADPA